MPEIARLGRRFAGIELGTYESRNGTEWNGTN